MDQLVRMANETPRATLDWATSFEVTVELLRSAA
jgi:IS30 family transposase